MTTFEQKFSPSRAVRIPALTARVPMSRSLFVLGVTLTDLVIVLAAVFLAQFSRFAAAKGANTIAVGELTYDYLLVSLTISLLWLGALAVFRTRDPGVIGVGAEEYRRVLIASTAIVATVAIVSFTFQIDVARGYLAMAFPVGLASLCLNRKMWRLWLVRKRVAGNYLARVLVVGTKTDVQFVAEKIQTSPGTGYKVVAIGTDDAPVGSSLLVKGTTIPVTTGINEIAASAHHLEIDAVVVAGTMTGGPEGIKELSWELESNQVELVVTSPLLDISDTRIHHRPVDGLPLMHVRSPEHGGASRDFKGIFDRTAAALSLLILSPVFLGIAALIKINDAGPVFFRQARVGRNGKLFSIVKFRTMSTDAEAKLDGLLEHNEGAGPLFKIKQDPRITSIGSILRKLSLDELPQLWNVLTGEMSLVGPRPALPREVATYEGFAGRRLLTKPGITGLWQVSGRSDLDWEQGLRLDLHYVENWSFSRDLIILGRTVAVVINPRGAY